MNGSKQLMYGTAWKAHRGTYRYKIQMNEIKGKRAFNRLYKEYEKDWLIVGNGYGKKQDEFILIVARNFDSEEAWLTWARSVDYPLIEQTAAGRPKPYKLGIHYKQRKVK